MPKMDWERFREKYYRPHLVVSDIRPGVDVKSLEATLELLAVSLDVSGDYAIRNDGAKISAVFERDVDAERFGGMLHSAATRRDVEWASRSVGHLNRADQRRIVAALRQHRAKNPKGRH